MGLGACYQFMKYVLIVFNFIILILGGIAIGLGAWSLATDNGGEELSDLTGESSYKGVAIAIIVGGCILVVIALFGCLGAFLENRVLLGIYFTIMLLLLILYAVGAALGFAFWDDLSDELEEQLEETLLEDYGVDSDGKPENNSVTDAWDRVQKDLKCCGVSGNASDEKSWKLWQKSAWFRAPKNQNSTMYVPESCCNKDAANNKCPNHPVPLPTKKPTEVYGEGCVDKLKDEVEDHLIAIAGIAVAILIVLLLAVVFSVCVCIEIGRHAEGKMV